MFSLPASRHWLLPALLLLVSVLVFRSIIPVPGSVSTIVRINRVGPEIQYGIEIPDEIVEKYSMPIPESSETYLWPEQKYYYTYSNKPQDKVTPYLEALLKCRHKPNPYTKHIRLPTLVQNVSQLTSPSENALQQKFNPTMIALPPWSEHQYLLVSRVVTEGFHQESLLCEADTCYAGGSDGRRPGEKDCSSDDLAIVGAAGGLHCATEPKIISIPPTPAEKCEGDWSSFPNIPGFHDPRIFWSGKGEPLIMVNSASRYACVGLWTTDLRTLHEPLKAMLQGQPGQPYHPGPLMSYPHLTELTRNPASTRGSVEKNWFMFFPTPSQSFLHYDLSIPKVVTTTEANTTKTKFIGGRTFAQLIGNGFTTPNLTSPLELPCLPDEPDTRGKHGHWHQATNALKLILCHRSEAEKGTCSEEQEGRAVHFAVMHRKFSNEWDLPLRYERFFAVWEARRPFKMLGVSKFPVLMGNETASGWSPEENWAGGEEEADTPTFTTAKDIDERVAHNNASTFLLKEKEIPHANLTKRSSYNTSHPSRQGHMPEMQNWAYFTYTPSISWAFRPHPALKTRESEHPEKRNEEEENEEHTRTLEALNVGYLDDEIIMGIGVDDVGQGFARVRVEDVLGCLRVCPSWS
jgi:hypothetical protein